MNDSLANILTQQVGEGKDPEGIEVIVVNAPPIRVTEFVARLVAPLIAERLYPDRAVGPVIHMEHHEAGVDGDQPEHWHCVVQDFGPDYGQIMGKIRAALS